MLHSWRSWQLPRPAAGRVLGALAWCHGQPGPTKQHSTWVLLGFGVTRGHFSCLNHPSLAAAAAKKKKMYPNPVNKDFGLWRQSVSRRGVSVFSSTSWGSPAHPAPPEKLCRGTRDRAGRVEGPGFYQVSQYLGQSLPFWTLFPSAEWGASDALHCTLWIII